MLYRKLLSKIHPMAVLPLGLAFFVLLAPAQVQATGSNYSLEVSKSLQELLVKDGDQVVRRFRVAIGRGGDGTKRQRGDNKTPTGQYKVLDFKANSRFHFFMLINYPNQVDAWHGYIDDRISAREFKQIIVANRQNQVPPQDTLLGGYIGLHGIGEMNEDKLSIHQRENWTEGCIALTNEEISELRNYVTIGTPIHIRD